MNHLFCPTEKHKDPNSVNYFRYTIALIISFCLHATISAQSYYLTLNKYQTQYRDKNSNETIELFAYPYQGTQVDLRDFKSKIPQAACTDFITIQPPATIDSANCVVFICFVQSLDQNDSGTLAIFLANNYQLNSVELFIDQNLDFNFNNETGMPFLVQRGEDPITIVVEDPKNGNRKRNFLFDLPLLESPKVIEKDKTIETIRKSTARSFPLYFQGFVTVGSGELKYSYTATKNSFPAEYKVSFTTKGLGCASYLDFQNVRIGLNATFENYFFYTSYLKYQYRVEEYDSVYNSLGELTRVYKGNTYTNSSFDSHQRNRISTAATLTYAFRVGKKISIAPGVEGGYVHYFNKNYTYNTAKAITYSNATDLFAQYNVTFIGHTDKRTEIYLMLSMQEIWWKPDVLFEDLVESNLKSNQVTFKTTIGISF